MPLIEAKGLALVQNGQTILRDVDFTIDKGEIVTLIGPNGSGKSSLVRALMGALPPAKGTVVRQRNLSIGYMPQKLAVDATLPMTVRGLMNLPRPHAADAIARAANWTGIDAILDNQLIGLSGGQFQRAMLARAILMDPDILILDEPTQGLDQPGTAGFYKLLEQLRVEYGAAVLLVSHDLHVVMSASDRVLCLNGHICCEGTPQVVQAAPEYRALFGPGTAGTMALYRHEHDHAHDHDQGSASH